MISLRINGHHVDLREDAAVTLIRKNEFFSLGAKKLSYSLPFSIPRTPQNDRFLGFASRPDVSKVQNEYPNTLLLFKGLPIQEGRLEILSFDTQNYKATFYFDLSGPMVAMTHKLWELPMDRVEFSTAEEVALWFNASVNHTWRDGIAFPLLQAENLLDRNDIYDGFVNHNYDEFYVIALPVVNRKARFCVAYPFLRYILEKISAFYQIELVGDLMTSPALLNVLVESNYVVNEWDDTAVDPKTTRMPLSIDYADTMPDITVIEFLFAVSDFLNYQLTYDYKTRQLKFEDRQALLNGLEYQDLSANLLVGESGELGKNEYYRLTYTDDYWGAYPPLASMPEGFSEKNEKLAASTLTNHIFYWELVNIDRRHPRSFVQGYSPRLQDVIMERDWNWGLTTDRTKDVRLFFWHGLQQNLDGSIIASASNSSNFEGGIDAEWNFEIAPHYARRFSQMLDVKGRSKRYTRYIYLPIHEAIRIDLSKPIRMFDVLYFCTEAQIKVKSTGIEPIKLTLWTI